MKTKLLCAGVLVLGSITLVACATPTATPVPPTDVPPTQPPVPTPTAIPPMSTPMPPTPTPRPLPQASIRVGDLDRTYLYYVPANLPHNAPLLFALHGYTQDAEGLRGWTGYEFESKADRNGFIVVYLNGYQQSWNVCLKAGVYPAKKQNTDDVGFIRALIAKFRGDYGINPSWVFAMGMSNGGQMVYRLALELPMKLLPSRQLVLIYQRMTMTTAARQGNRFLC